MHGAAVKQLVGAKVFAYGGGYSYLTVHIIHCLWSPQIFPVCSDPTTSSAGVAT